MILGMQATIRHFEHTLLSSFTGSGEIDLPQIADDDETVIELMQDISARPHEEVAMELHHQIDQSYE